MNIQERQKNVQTNFELEGTISSNMNINEELKSVGKTMDF